MRTSITAYALAAALGMLAAAPATAAAELQPVVTERTADVTMRLLVEGGKLLVGRNDIVLELDFSPERRAVSAVTLVANQETMPVEIGLSRVAAGRFHGTMILPLTENCRLNVSWQDDRGHHSHPLTVPVSVGHH
jgi:hypothetical protein